MAQPNLNPVVTSGPWRRGMDSLSDPIYLNDESVQYSVNTMNRGGVYQTRPGFVYSKGFTPFRQAGFPRGMILFTPLDKAPVLVAVTGQMILCSEYPFATWRQCGTIQLDDSHNPVSMVIGVKGATTNPSGTLTVLDDPYPLLIIQTGVTPPVVWDGIINPRYATTIPVFDHMKWIGGRLWGAKGAFIRVSNILDPLTFTEGDNVAEVGSFSLSGSCTGMGVTVDQQSLLAFTTNETTSFQAGIRDRSTWATTKDFKKVLFADIGCVAPNSITNQYGLLWWLSQKGLIGLDDALRSYRTSEVKVKDSNMARSKANMALDLSRSCAGIYENILMVSVPSGDTYNAHTWILDQNVVDLIDEQSPAEWASIWTGIRPVQIVSDNINGQNRCFALSVDYPPTGSDELWRVGVWEMFCGVKHDYPFNESGFPVAKQIDCLVETKMLGFSPDYKVFGFIDWTFDQIEGAVHFDGYYSSSHSGYKQVLSKNVISTSESIIYNVQYGTTNPILSYLKQTRTIRSSNDLARLSDGDGGIEFGVTRNRDRAFSILTKWQGDAALKKIQLFTRPEGDTMEGKVEANESTRRYITPDGVSTVSIFPPVPVLYLSGLTTTPISTISPRWSEEVYKSTL